VIARPAVVAMPAMVAMSPAMIAIPRAIVPRLHLRRPCRIGRHLRGHRTDVGDRHPGGDRQRRDDDSELPH